MRTAAALLVLAAVAVSHTALGQETPNKELQDKLKLNKDLIRLLKYHRRGLDWDDLTTITKTYSILPENYQNPEVANDFLNLWRRVDLLPFGQSSSVLDDKQMNTIKRFFNLLYFAKDYDNFYKTAVYLRELANRDEFLVAFLTAVKLRQDMMDLVFPPLYEITPDLFVTSDVVQQAYDAGLTGGDRPFIIIDAKYTGYPDSHTPEKQLSYFLEDVGLNDYFADFNYRYPYFLSAANYTMPDGSTRGEVFYHTLRQLYARYYLERLSLGLPDVPPMIDDKPSLSDYYPKVRLVNGNEIPPRPAKVDLLDGDVSALHRIWFSEYRLTEAIDMGLAISATRGRFRYNQSEAINMLGNMVQSNADSIHPRYYGALYRDLLSYYGKYLDPMQSGVVASVFGKYETTLRDPFYFQIVKRVLNVFQLYQNNLEPYKREELEIPGLTIVAVFVDTLETYFDLFDFEMNNMLLPPNVEKTEGKATARIQRLNNKKFMYRIKTISEKYHRVVFRVYLGPRYDSYGNEMTLDEARPYFFLLDRFVSRVNPGEYEVVRDPRDSEFVRGRPLSTHELESALDGALQGNQTTTLPEKLWGFPDRLLLPRGTRAGLPLRFYVIASRLGEDVPASADGRSVAFPFDRPIPVNYDFNVPNSRIEDVMVYYKRIDEINS